MLDRFGEIADWYGFTALDLLDEFPGPRRQGAQHLRQALETNGGNLGGPDQGGRRESGPGEVGEGDVPRPAPVLGAGDHDQLQQPEGIVVVAAIAADNDQCWTRLPDRSIGVGEGALTKSACSRVSIGLRIRIRIPFVEGPEGVINRLIGLDVGED